MNNENNNGLMMLAAWFNAIIGTLFSEPVLSGFAYLASIAGSTVYIYTTIKKNKTK
jgi:hypothetical protein